jgi:death-on-curing protein
MLLFFFTKGHCFVDGNKRIGIQSAIVLLTINGFIDFLDDYDGYIKTLEVAYSRLSC